MPPVFAFESRRNRRAWVLLLGCAIVLAVFALYAPAARLMPFNDDAPELRELIGITPLSIFENRYAPFGLVFGHYRPLGYLHWVVIQQLFGWYLPSMLHLLNVFAHTLATALVFGVALRLARLFKLPALGFAALSALMFGFLPLAYQSVLWAAALPHPQVSAFGFAAVFAYLVLPEVGRRRALGLLIVLALMFAGFLSHEQGPIIGAFVLWAEVARALATRTRPRAAGFAFLAVAAGYFIFYRSFLRTTWTSSGSLLLEGGLNEAPTKFAYHLQNLMIWPAAFLRPLLSLDETGAVALLYALAAALLGASVVLFWRRGRVRAAVAVVGFWLIGALPSMTLSQRYLLDGPRMLYPSSLGSAMFWALLTVTLWQLAAQREALRVVVRTALVAMWAVVLAWSAGFVRDRMNETARLTPAMQQVDADLRASQPGDKLLFVNTPFVNLAKNPSFFIGREGMPVWMSFYADETMAPGWPGSVSGVIRPTFTVMHEASLSDRETNFRAPEFLFTQGEKFRYGVFGKPVDDAGLRDSMLRSNFVYRFDYDPPGFRLTRLGALRPADPPQTPLATFSRDDGRVALMSARAQRCDGAIVADLTWADARGLSQPTGVFVHGLDANGQQILMADRDPLDGGVPIDRLPAATQLTERRIVPLPADKPAPTELRLGLHARTDGQRFQATRANGALWDGEQVSVPVTECAQR